MPNAFCPDSWVKYWPYEFHNDPTPVYIEGRWYCIWETTDGLFFLKQTGNRPLMIGDALQTEEFINQYTMSKKDAEIKLDQQLFSEEIGRYKHQTVKEFTVSNEIVVKMLEFIGTVNNQYTDKSNPTIFENALISASDKILKAIDEHNKL